jgi:uroporphyrinogen III methyltransferase / synthase
VASAQVGSRSLEGRSVIVTRARAQASVLAATLRDAGAEVLELPLIRIEPPASWESLDAILEDPGRYDWVVFTSTNGVDFFFRHLRDGGRDPASLAGCRIGAVGRATARALEDEGILVDGVPERFEAIELLPLLGETVDGLRVALVRAAAGREELVDALRAGGARVDVAVAYETHREQEHVDTIRGLIRERRLDIVTFTSPSTVAGFFEPLSGEERLAVLEQATLCSIGRVTTRALATAGAHRWIEAPQATTEALAEEIIRRCGGTR